MDLLTPFEFVDSFEAGQRVAVVGNAPTLAGRKAGKWIDSHDIVIRFNDCRVRGFEADVGSKTDILISNPYAETRPGSYLNDLLPPVTVLVINPQTRRGNKEEFLRWVGNNRVLFTYTPDLKIDTLDRQHIALTTGTYGVSLVANLLKPKNLSVTGFTMFAAGSDYHYWSDITPSGIKAHSPQTEAHVFVDMLNSLRVPVEATPEIFEMAKRSNKNFADHVRLHHFEPKAGRWRLSI
ncbi:hypothetical protein A6U87_28360 [Rhizobium sp. AC44/96]|jgi:hypothetical protein|uniref:glycosyltransferase family 29 protein n=1 Tax=Rhizobium sp. AC44/96 TaxID=1841654 RepID=UPI00080F9F73|nr:glycosyltransferase family 29 protein [Rhizobium sp. AC44/96]OCJ10222.1 hypothetical protein A6U87_28360 [Rhizobium sp. AC44/96]